MIRLLMLLFLLLLQLLLQDIVIGEITTTATTRGKHVDEIDASLLESFIINLPSSSSLSSRSILDKYQQYSGYLNATHPIYGCCGCTTSDTQDKDTDTDTDADDYDHSRYMPDVCQLHYWYIIEKEDVVHDDDDTMNTNHKPTILWMNGGPGASSVIGLLQEMGPFLITSTSRTNKNDTNPKHQVEQPMLIENPYRWTQFANLLVIENPVGVGYSYCSNNVQHHGPCYNSDNSTARMTLYALLDFYTTKFPTRSTSITTETTKDDLYIIGESYAGVYIPTLSNEILQYNTELMMMNDTTVPKIPLVGIAVGDPCTDTDAQSYYMNPMWYSYQYGLLDDAIYTMFSNTSSTTQCDTSKIQQYDETSSWDTDDYIRNIYKDDHVCRMAYRKYLFSTSRGISAYKNWKDAYLDRYSLYGMVTQNVNEMTELFMNHPIVRQALHIPEFIYKNDTRYWTVHSTSSTMKYTKQYNACNHIPHKNNNQRHTNPSDDENIDSATNSSTINTVQSMIDIYRNIVYELPSGIMIYNGNTDPAISYEGTRTAVKRIGISELDGGSYRPWFYHHTNTSFESIQHKNLLFGDTSFIGNHDMGIQLGGHVTNYKNGLLFVTVHGSGHLVPQNRPQATYRMISNFVLPSITNCTILKEQFESRLSVPEQMQKQCILLSPLLPSNASLLAMNDSSEFFQTLSNWTELAKLRQYTGG